MNTEAGKIQGNFHTWGIEAVKNYQGVKRGRSQQLNLVSAISFDIWKVCHANPESMPQGRFILLLSEASIESGFLTTTKIALVFLKTIPTSCCERETLLSIP
jgi:hypothetical protein